jgi:class 3 adenylate cyclase/tetratricopeptide (TPR) repeat protein
MDCPHCHHQNAAGSRFCGACGWSLIRDETCSRCGHANPGGQEFCNGCGQRLGEAAAPAARDPRAYTPQHLAAKILQSKSALEGERKQVTVLFADVKGSMELAEQLDPEDWHRIMDRFFQLLAEGVHRFEGTVVQFTGDGVMALFGAPLAHEDHAQRACWAALHLAEELRRYAQQLRREGGLDFAVRLGLNSGEVVVGKIGDDLRMDYTAQGHTVGLAQRMEQLAETGRIYLTEHTAALVSGLFRLEDLGHFTVKGASERLRVYELAGLGPHRTRLDVARTRGFSRFVGRSDDMAALEVALARALGGNGQVIGVVAEPGVGKSRLCYEFAGRCRARGLAVDEAHGVAHGKAIPFLPVIEYLRAYFGITERDADQAAREKIAGKLLLLDPQFADSLPLLFDFLGVSDPERPAPRTDPEVRQRLLFAAMKRLVHARSRREPGVTVVEDLHWIDAGSEAFLENFVEAAAGTRTLVVVNFRPEYHAGWMQKSYYRQLPLAPLGAEASAELLRDLLGADPSLGGLADRIWQRTAGNPFFIEEIVQGLVEAGHLHGSKGAYRLATPPGDEALPGTVQAVLAARIDRLGEREKSVLQTAAVIGKQFTEAVLRHVAELAAAEVAAALDALVRSEFLYEEALYPEAAYAFKHPLTQEVAYRSQLGARRAKVHAAVARTIATLYPERLDQKAAELAHHWEAAGDVLEAARWHGRAAEWTAVSDAREALRHWRRVRTLLEPLPAAAATCELGLRARTGILNLGWRLGIDEAEARALLAEGRALAARTREPHLLAQLVVAYGGIRLWGGGLDEALERSEEAARLADEAGEPGSRLGACISLSYAHLLTGQLREALTVAEDALVLARANPEAGADVLGIVPHVFFFMARGEALMEMGRLDESASTLERGAELAHELQAGELLGWIHGDLAELLARRGDMRAALDHASRALQLAETVGTSFNQLAARQQLGWVHVHDEQWKAAADSLGRALAVVRETRTGVPLEPWILAGLGRARLGLGDGAGARVAAEEAIDAAKRLGTRAYEVVARLALAHALTGTEGLAARRAINDTLERATALVEETGARSWEPWIHVERAALARVRGDEVTRQRELGEALRLFTQMGASGHAERVARELGSSAGSASRISSTSRT